MKTAHGLGTEHCFPAWYLHHELGLPEEKALEQSSDGNYDYGIDAFNLDPDEKNPRLLLLQAKYSESVAEIGAGLRGLERSLGELGKILETVGADAPIQNKVLVNLRVALDRVEPTVRKSLELSFVVLHLCHEDRAIVDFKTRAARTKLREGIEKFFPDRKASIADISPHDLGPRRERIIPAVETTIRVGGLHSIQAAPDVTMHYGVGRLSDLVNLYLSRRENLFSKNVRYYIYKKRNIERGPAGKMRDTLKQIAITGKIEPEMFGLYHNGVTIHAAKVEPGENGSLSVREPYVLNGCQTIKTAFFFRNDPNLRERISPDRWERITVPVKIIETRKDDVVRTVTINNNRQNAISYAALRANDPVQLELQERFRRRKVFYERQEGAYAAVEATSPEVLEDEYEHTRGSCVEIVDLARSIAAAAGEVSLAEHPEDLFESETAYDRCFSQKRISSVVFLTFLQNLHDVVGVILKKDLNLVPVGGGPSPSYLKYRTMCLVVRYLAKQNDRDFIENYGVQLGGDSQNFRDDVRKLIKRSGIRKELGDRFMTLDSREARLLDEAFERAQNVLRLRVNIDPFESFRELDRGVPLLGEGDQEASSY